MAEGNIFAFDVCCTAEISAACKDRFIEANLDFTGEPLLRNVVFVDSLRVAFSDDDVPTLGNNTVSPATSLFAGKDAADCFQLLMQLSQEDGSSINPEPFAILDERSMQDGTALLCEASEEGIWTVRAAFAMVESRLHQYFASDASLDEDQGAAARCADGVLRAV